MEIFVVINGILVVNMISWEGLNGFINMGGFENMSIFVDELGIYMVIVIDDVGCIIMVMYLFIYIVCLIDIELDKSVDNLNLVIGDVVIFII